MTTFSNKALKEIRIAERAYYEQVFNTGALALVLYICFNKIEPLTLPERFAWVEERALKSLEVWRAHFCPSRVGTPYESEWLLSAALPPDHDNSVDP